MYLISSLVAVGYQRIGDCWLFAGISSELDQMQFPLLSLEPDIPPNLEIEFLVTYLISINDINELTDKTVNRVKDVLTDLEIGLDLIKRTERILILSVEVPHVRDIPELDIAGHTVEKKDLPSNQLYAKMAAFIENVRPKIFMFENVKGILSGRWTSEGQKGEIWEDVRARFRQIEGYFKCAGLSFTPNTMECLRIDQEFSSEYVKM